MKLLFENWRRYLNEVTFSDAKDILDSKRTIKIIKAYRYDKGQDDTINSPDAPLINTQHRNFKNYLLELVPHDLTDNQKGTSVLWLLKMARENPKMAAKFIDGRIYDRQRFMQQSLETFFHHQRFMPKQDLMQVKTMEDLVDMTDAAKEEIEVHRQSKFRNINVIDEGTTFLSGGWNKEIPSADVVNKMSPEEQRALLHDLETVPGKSGMVIMIINNKAASCFHGTADWCTANPTGDYFEAYYKPDDPLFIFDRGGEKYQFHYGSSQFMDSKDNRVNDESFKALHDMLKQALKQKGAYGKYEKIRILDLEKMVKGASWDASAAQAQAQIDEMRENLFSLADPYSMANSLADLATYQHFNVPTYILRWLAGEEFYKYIGVALRIVRYHSVVPSDILEDIAENNPQERTRRGARAVLKMRKGHANDADIIMALGEN